MIILRQKQYGIIAKAGKAIKSGKKTVKDLAWKMELNPRGTIKEGLAKTAENPITIASQIAAAPAHMVDASTISPAAVPVVAALPNSVPYVLGEAALKKHVPSYAKATKKAGESVRKSKTLDAAMGIQPKVTFQNAGPGAKFKDKAMYNIQSGLADISGGIQGAGKSALKLVRGYSQREYSYLTAKRLVNSIKQVKGSSNKLMTSIDNAGLRAGNYVKSVITGKATPEYKKMMFRPKTEQELKKEALGTAKKVRNAENSIATDPYKVIGSKTNELIIKPTIDAPLGTVATKVLPVPGASAIHAKTTAPLESKMWDRIGVGRVTKPIRQSLKKTITDDKVAGTFRGFTNGLKVAMA